MVSAVFFFQKLIYNNAGQWLRWLLFGRWLRLGLLFLQSQLQVLQAPGNVVFPHKCSVSAIANELTMGLVNGMAEV